jgi:SpoVK/Ycf46/Vps4 family AAA+-type ATPase
MQAQEPGKLHQTLVQTGAVGRDDQRGADAGGVTQAPVFAEEELLIASPVVVGFSFSEKCWLELSLSGMEDVKWNNEAYDALVLPHSTKQELRDLVRGHRLRETYAGDGVVRSRGTGLNVMLHGPPGVGKTLTCEAVAEHLECPLYVVRPGEISGNAESVEQQLGEIFAMAHTWRAIVLLDDADVFLEARQPGDMHRNSIVSVFLQCLDNHRGVLFLVLNQVEGIDEGLQCRLHMGIRYESLPATARKKIWQHHLGKVEQEAADGKEGEKRQKLFSEVDYKELSERVLNGRQVRWLATLLFGHFTATSRSDHSSEP